MENLEKDQAGVDIRQSVNKAESFLEQNKKNLTIGLIALVVIVGGWFAYSQLIQGPKEKEAANALFHAERWFARDSFNLVINGNGTFDGAVAVADNYGSTKSGSIAAYMAGIAYYKTGDFQNAITYLEKADLDDHILKTLALGTLGDAHAELNDLEKAVDYYAKASKADNNDLTTPFYLKKAGMIYESLNQYDKAYAAYKNINDNYKESIEANDIEKFLYRAGVKIGKTGFEN